MAHEWEKFELSPETRRNVLALFWFLAGMLATLSLFGVGGRVGVWLKPKLFTWMGWGTYVIPFVVTAVAEIVGCYCTYVWIKKSGSAWLGIPAVASLCLFAWLLTLHPSPVAGRVYAAYGGVYVASGPA